MFDERAMMLQAYIIAKESKDRSTQNSALILHPTSMQILCGAVNDIPKNLDRPERRERPLKYKYTVHAEHNAIMMCAQHGIPTFGKIMFAPWAACQACALTIVTAGIREVWTHELVSPHNQWIDDVKLGLQTLREGGVAIHIFDGRLDETGATTILRNGEVVKV